MWRGRAKPSLCCNVNCRTIWASTSRTHIAVSGVKSWGHVCPSFGSIYHHVYKWWIEGINVLVCHFMCGDCVRRPFKVCQSCDDCVWVLETYARFCGIDCFDVNNTCSIIMTKTTERVCWEGVLVTRQLLEQHFCVSRGTTFWLAYIISVQRDCVLCSIHSFECSHIA